MAKNSHLPDKKNAPKKTGKRGIKPLDPEADFDKAVTQQTEMSAGPRGSSLLVEQPPKPRVVGDRFEAFYLKPFFQKDPKTGKLSVALAFSVALEKEHRPLLPKMVSDAYHDILKKGRKGMQLRSIPGQQARIYISHDAAEELLDLPAAKVMSAALALIEKKGEGSARKIIRFSFRLQVPIPKDAKSDPVSYFAERNLQNNFWMKLDEANASLFEDEDEDSEE
jgi:hypothetical protein